MINTDDVNNTIWSNGGDDKINAGLGNDVVDAGTGNDLITGGGGDDTIISGLGADTIIYRSGDGNDTIIDFNVADGDKIDLTRLTSVHSFSDLTITQDGLDATVAFGSTITLKNFDKGDLTSARFLFSQQVIEGYVSGATVFADLNNNGELDPGEPTTTTDAQGNFTLPGGTAPLIAFGGADGTTGLPFLGQFSAPSGSRVITPLTTLVNILQSKGVPGAEQKVLNALGLSPDLDLESLDPIGAAKAGDLAAGAAQVAAAKVYDTVAVIAATLAGAGGAFNLAAQDGFLALASAIKGSIVNFTDEATLAAMITQIAQAENLTLGPGVAESTASVIAAGNASLDLLLQTADSGEQLLQGSAAIELVMQGTVAAAFAQAAGDPDQLDHLANLFSSSHLDALINLAESKLENPDANAAPLAFDGSAATNEDTPVNGTLAAVELDQDALSFVVVSGPGHGGVALNGENFVYTPNANFHGRAFPGAGLSSYDALSEPGARCDGASSSHCSAVEPLRGRSQCGRNKVSVCGGWPCSVVLAQSIRAILKRRPMSQRLGRRWSNWGGSAVATCGSIIAWAATMSSVFANSRKNWLRSHQMLS